MKKIIICAVLTLVCLLTWGQTSVKISDMPSASSLAGGELVPVVQSGANKKATVTQFITASSIYTGTSPTTVTVGGLPSGSSVSGQTVSQILQSIIAPYIAPTFASFLTASVPQTVEVGTTLSGVKTFDWQVNINSGVVPTISIRDQNLGSNIITNTPNDMSEDVTITTIQLNSNGANQTWYGIGNNTSPVGTFNSNNYTVTARFYYWWAPVSASLTNSASVRALANSAFRINTGQVFTLNTGSTLTKFVVALPPGISITSVVDLDALNANITSQYVQQSNINVLDAGATNHSYNIFEMNIASPYSSNHRHQITIQ